MKWTRANVSEHAKSKGFDPVQINGIPDGFAYMTPDITIGSGHYKGMIVAYVPLTDHIVQASNVTDLLTEYNEHIQYVQRDNKRAERKGQSKGGN
jgi:hypothetical protein